jgi:hypothetical protein
MTIAWSCYLYSITPSICSSRNRTSRCSSKSRFDGVHTRKCFNPVCIVYQSLRATSLADRFPTVAHAILSVLGLPASRVRLVLKSGQLANKARPTQHLMSPRLPKGRVDSNLIVDVKNKREMIPTLIFHNNFITNS